MSAVRITDSKTAIVTNLKCGYSWLTRLCEWQKAKELWRYRIPSPRIIRYRLKKCTRVVFLLRHPMRRLESFFLDKMVRHRKSLEVGQRAQICQQKMTKYYDRSTIVENKMTLSLVVDAIRRGYRDAHVSPQSIWYEKLCDALDDIKVETIEFKLDSEPMLKLANDELHLSDEQRSVKPNNSNTARQECTDLLNLNTLDKQFVRQFYAKDFELYDRFSAQIDRGDLFTIE